MERRREPRCAVNENVDVYVVNGRSRQLLGPAVMRDISISGACIHMEARLPSGTEVRLVSSKRDFLATVRHIGVAYSGYLIGLEFTTPCKNNAKENWSPLAATW
jgi:hypothetical protein